MFFGGSGCGEFRRVVVAVEVELELLLVVFSAVFLPEGVLPSQLQRERSGWLHSILSLWSSLLRDLSSGGSCEQIGLLDNYLSLLLTGKLLRGRNYLAVGVLCWGRWSVGLRQSAETIKHGLDVGESVARDLPGSFGDLGETAKEGLVQVCQMNQSIELLVVGGGAKANGQLEALVKADLHIVRHLDIWVFEGQRHSDHLIEPVALQEVLSIFLGVESDSLVSLEERQLDPG